MMSKYRWFGWLLGLYLAILALSFSCTGTPTNEPLVEIPIAENLPTELVPDAATPDFKEPNTEPKVEEPGPPEPTPETQVSDRSPDVAPDRAPPEPLPERLADTVDMSDFGMPELIPDGALPRPGFGAISGDCGVLDDTEWKSSKSFLFRNNIDFGTMNFDETKLTTGGQKIWKDGNLGGSSVHSEIFAYEILARCELATLLKSEAEILYKQSTGKKTDILVTIDGYKVGVSVTRAYHFPPQNPYTIDEAKQLLNKKLGDIPLSASNADPKDAWVRSILAVLAYDQQYADSVEAAYKQLDPSVQASTILILTTTDGQDSFIY